MRRHVGSRGHERQSTGPPSLFSLRGVLRPSDEIDAFFDALDYLTRMKIGVWSSQYARPRYLCRSSHGTTARKCCQGRSRNGRLRSTTATADEPLRHSLPSIRSSHDRGAHNQVPRPTQASISCLETVCVESARHTYTYVITQFPEPFILYAIVSCLVTPCMELPRNTHTYVMPRFPELFIVYRVPA